MTVPSYVFMSSKLSSGSHSVIFNLLYICSFFADVSSIEPSSEKESDNDAFSVVSDASVLMLHKLLWANQEKIGQYLAINR